jgi:hypothetical protein
LDDDGTSNLEKIMKEILKEIIKEREDEEIKKSKKSYIAKQPDES